MDSMYEFLGRTLMTILLAAVALAVIFGFLLLLTRLAIPLAICFFIWCAVKILVAKYGDGEEEVEKKP